MKQYNDDGQAPGRSSALEWLKRKLRGGNAALPDQSAPKEKTADTVAADVKPEKELPSPVEEPQYPYNLFVDCHEVTGTSFFGREALLNSLSTWIQEPVARSLSLVGPARVGKSSLMKEALERNRACFEGADAHQILIFLTLDKCGTVKELWSRLFFEVEKSLRRAELMTEELEQELTWVNWDAGTWYHIMEPCLTKMLQRLARQDIYLLLVLDEFDRARELFQDGWHHFGLLRSYASDAYIKVKCATLSRRRPHVIEGVSEGRSSFHGVFAEEQIRPFDEKEMQAYFAALAQYDVVLDQELREQLYYSAGTYPYLLCIYAHKLVEYRQQGRDIDLSLFREIYWNKLPTIDQFYQDIARRLVEDKDMDTLLEYFFGTGQKADWRTLDLLSSMGLLQKRGERYVCLSDDFTDYLRRFYLNRPLWDTIMETERKLKKIFGQEFTKLTEIHHSSYSAGARGTWETEVYRAHKLTIREEMLYRNMRDLVDFGEDPTLLDATQLGFVIEQILKGWDTRFSKYFHMEQKNLWEPRLKRILQVRGLFAHAHGEKISEEQELEVTSYCDAVLAL